MYKRQVKLQKVFCLLAIIASAAVFVYALGLVTDLHDSLKDTMPFVANPSEDYVAGARIFYDIQPFNQQLMLAGLGLILLSLGLFLTNTHTRRRYYIGNYLATAIWAIAAVAVAIWSHIQIAAFKAQYLTTVDFAALKEYADSFGSYYTESTFWFDVHYLICGLAIVVAIILVANLFWKINLMKSEAALLEKSKAVAK